MKAAGSDDAKQPCRRQASLQVSPLLGAKALPAAQQDWPHTQGWSGRGRYVRAVTGVSHGGAQQGRVWVGTCSTGKGLGLTAISSGGVGSVRLMHEEPIRRP